jgi:hypothetical protein
MRIIFFTSLFVLLNIGTALSDDLSFLDSMSLRELKVFAAKKAVKDGYLLGTLADSPAACDAIVDSIKKGLIKDGKPWDSTYDDLNNILHKSCLLGYAEKDGKEYSLPELLHYTDFVADMFY